MVLPAGKAANTFAFVRRRYESGRPLVRFAPEVEMELHDASEGATAGDQGSSKPLQCWTDSHRFGLAVVAQTS